MALAAPVFAGEPAPTGAVDATTCQRRSMLRKPRIGSPATCSISIASLIWQKSSAPARRWPMRKPNWPLSAVPWR
ncbi:hypothetical protein EZZ80_10845 [Pseudomonas putida]|nr:hypothetical protein DM483_19590 [Pseudomonas sp. SMT-1]QDW57748.1 hypothetical protein FFH79_013065 [Pseudomonas sp. KBS0802]UZA73969.1 hypothetical protein EZZ80_10845 [Pseudomonas putida]